MDIARQYDASPKPASLAQAALALVPALPQLLPAEHLPDVVQSAIVSFGMFSEQARTKGRLVNLVRTRLRARGRELSPYAPLWIESAARIAAQRFLLGAESGFDARTGSYTGYRSPLEIHGIRHS